MILKVNQNILKAGDDLFRRHIGRPEYFSFSSYIPTLFGFNNRNLGAIRLFYTLLIISGVIYLSVN
jgi:hypothetical protein